MPPTAPSPAPAADGKSDCELVAKLYANTLDGAFGAADDLALVIAALVARESEAGHPLLKYKFDPRQERERKAEFERLYHRSAQEVRGEMQRLEQAKALEAKLKLQKKMAKPGGRASGVAALRACLSAQVSGQ